MKRTNTSVVAALFCTALFFLSSCTKEVVNPNKTNPKNINAKAVAIEPNQLYRANKPSRPSANGQGALFLDYQGFTPAVQHFAFHAETNEEGITTGSFESKFGENGRVHGTINCLSILSDGKTAIMSGTITQVDGDTYIGYGFAVGDDAWFKVQDNGEGANATKDRFSDVYAYADLEPCPYEYNLELFTILNGNIQVKP